MKEKIASTFGIIAHILRNVMELKFLFLTILSISLMYFITNHSLIGVEKDTIYIYTTITLLALTLAIIRDISRKDGSEGILEKLTWKPASDGKYIKAPEKLHSHLLILLLAGLGTGIINIILKTQSGIMPTAINGQMAIEMTLEQLFVIALPETIIFQGLIPLIVADIVFKGFSKKEMDNAHFAWFLVAFMSQSFFAIMHQMAYGGDLENMVKVGILGIAWQFMYRRFGPAAAWGSHWVFNLTQLGIIAGASSEVAYQIIQLIGGM